MKIHPLMFELGMKLERQDCEARNAGKVRERGGTTFF